MDIKFDAFNEYSLTMITLANDGNGLSITNITYAKYKVGNKNVVKVGIRLK